MFPDGSYYDEFTSRIDQLKLLFSVENRNCQIISKNKTRIKYQNRKTSSKTSKLRPGPASFSKFER